MDFSQPAAAETIDTVLKAVSERGMTAEAVATPAEALARIQALIPAKSSVSTGASVTLKQIGFEDRLKDTGHGWRNLKAEFLAEPDMAKQMELRRQSSLADWFLGSAHAVTHAGQLVFASATGSQLAPYAYTAKNVIWVVGAQKIVPTLDDAFRRIHEYIIPHEEERMRALTGGKMGTSLNKILIFEKESPFLGRKAHLIIVKQAVGD